MLSVIIPVFNEETILTASIERLHRYLTDRKFDHELIIINNGSTDQTEKAGKSLMGRYSSVKFISCSSRGPGRAFVLGVIQAQSENIVTLDIDLSAELTFLDHARHLLQYCDMLVGSKSMGNQRRSSMRAFGSQFYIHCAQLLFHLSTSDYSIGSKAFRKSSIINALPFLDTWTGHILELCLYLRVRGKRIIQVGINCEDQRTSHFNLFYEAIYRYLHLYRCWRLIKKPESWFHTAV